MAGYKVFIKPSAVKELDAVPKRDRQRIARRVQALADDPRPPGCEKLTGAHRYRVRQGRYRVVYAIDDTEASVTVFRIAHRREVYR